MRVNWLASVSANLVGALLVLSTPAPAKPSGPLVASDTFSTVLANTLQQGVKAGPFGMLTPEQALTQLFELKGYWTNGDMLWVVRGDADRVLVDTYQRGGDRSKGWEFTAQGGKFRLFGYPLAMIPGGAFHPTTKWALRFRKEGGFEIVPGRSSSGAFVEITPSRPSPIYGRYERRDVKFAVQFINNSNERVVERQQAKEKGGNSGLLGGLIMGGVAAVAGGDAGVVMGAAMKGVEMTTDNEMSRNVLAGQGDAMIQSSIDTTNIVSETERLRRAASEETRQKQMAGGAGRSSMPPAAPPRSPMPAASVGVAPTASYASAPRRTLYSYCYMTIGAKASHVSGIGSKSVSVDEQQQWRSSMEAEFRGLTGASGPHQCELSETSDFSYTRGEVMRDNTTVLAWSPH